VVQLTFLLGTHIFPRNEIYLILKAYDLLGEGRGGVIDLALFGKLCILGWRGKGVDLASHRKSCASERRMWGGLCFV